jgi:hypothetical protein
MGAVIINAGGEAEDICKLMVNFSWPLILSKYFFIPPPLNIINFHSPPSVIELVFQTYTIEHRRPNLAIDSINLYIIAMYIIVKICNKIKILK